MRNLFALLFMLPWWTYLPVAVGIGYIGQEAYQAALAPEAERRVAQSQDPPPAVDLSRFDAGRHTGLAREVQVMGWVHMGHSGVLDLTTVGISTGEKAFYLLFGLADNLDAQAVRAAMLLSPDEETLFLDQLGETGTGDRSSAPAVRLGGLAGTGGAMADEVDQALAARGLIKSDEFFVLEPFLEGRAAGLATMGRPEEIRRLFWALALAVALFGIAKKVFARPENPAAASVDPSRANAIQPPGGADKAMDYNHAFQARKRPVPLSAGIDPQSPYGRVIARSAPAPEPPKAIGVAPPPSDRRATGPRRPIWLLALGIGLIALGVAASNQGSQVLPALLGSGPQARPVILVWAGVILSYAVLRWKKLWRRTARPDAADIGPYLLRPESRVPRGSG